MAETAEKRGARARAYREAHLEELRAYDRERYRLQGHRQTKEQRLATTARFRKSAKYRAWYEAHKRERSVYAKAYRAAHREELKAYHQAKYRANRTARLEEHRQRTYGITRDQFLGLLQAQDGRCAICRRLFDLVHMHTKASPHVDHDHTTGEIRGLLCMSCNQALGLMQESLEAIQSMADYLHRHSMKGGLDTPLVAARARAAAPR